MAEIVILKSRQSLQMRISTSRHLLIIKRTAGGDWGTKKTAWRRFLHAANQLKPAGLTGQFKFHADLRLDFDWTSVQHIRLVFPLPDGGFRGASQILVTAYLFYIDDVASFGNCGCDFHRALKPQTKRILRVNRLDFLHDPALQYSLGNPQRLLNRFRDIHTGGCNGRDAPSSAAGRSHQRIRRYRRGNWGRFGLRTAALYDERLLRRRLFGCYSVGRVVILF